VEFERKFSIPFYGLQFLTVSLFCSIAVGAIWQLWLKDKIVCFVNRINVASGRNNIFIDGSLLNQMYDDGKDHFLVIEKDGKELLAGFYRASSSSRSERVELCLSAYPVYNKWLEYARTKNSDHPLNTVKGAYIDVTSGVIIKELDYPKEWLTSPIVKELKEGQAEAAAGFQV
jgi:hypothetical protein